MRSVKPGRGPSMMSGVVGLFMIGFGILWTVIAFSQVGVLFGLFGLLWTGIAVVQTVYCFSNAKRKHRFSEFDVVDDGEEPDPWNQKYGSPSAPRKAAGGFCPYCGAETQPDFDFCRGCGRKLP